MEGLPRLLVTIGLGLAALGLALHFFGGPGGLGRLPGDIRIERPGFRLYVPITTGILVSLALSLIAWLVSRWR